DPDGAAQQGAAQDHLHGHPRRGGGRARDGAAQARQGGAAMNIATYVRRNLFRRTGRTVLTMGVVALTVLIFCLIRTAIASFTGGVDDAAADRLATRHKVSITMQLPKHYIEELRQVPGVEKATWANWFGAKDPKRRVPFFA